MKKLLSLLLILTTLFCTILTPTTNAAVGDVVAQALHTDIVAYINHYAIPSYIVNGQSCVVAEDLRNFGFDVVFNNDTRTLMITRNSKIFYVREMTVDKSAATGEFFSNIVESDIKVYANQKQLPSYSLNGYTMVPIEELTVFGEVSWVPEERAIKLWVDGLNIRSFKQPPSKGSVQTTVQKQYLETSDINVKLIIPNKNSENSYAHIEICNYSDSDITISSEYVTISKKLWSNGLRPVKINPGTSKKLSVTLADRKIRSNATYYLNENCEAHIELEWKDKDYVIYFNSYGILSMQQVNSYREQNPYEFKTLDKNSINDLLNAIKK